MPKPDQRFFQEQHHNAIAKDIRNELAALYFELGLPGTSSADVRTIIIAQTSIINDLALRFAARFAIDNFDFDPVKWLQQCSPDENQWPLGELWNG